MSNILFGIPLGPIQMGIIPSPFWTSSTENGVSSLKSGKFFVLFIFTSIAFFVLFFLWIGFHKGPLGAAWVDRTVVCIDVDDAGVPYGVGDRFGYGVRQLCVLVNTVGGNGEDEIRFRWYFRDQIIYDEIQILDSVDKDRMFYLLQEDGTPLPIGSYFVQVDLNDRLVRRMAFDIVEAHGSVLNSQ